MVNIREVHLHYALGHFVHIRASITVVHSVRVVAHEPLHVRVKAKCPVTKGVVSCVAQDYSVLHCNLNCNLSYD